jgi:hypothetical protein
MSTRILAYLATLVSLTGCAIILPRCSYGRHQSGKIRVPQHQGRGLILNLDGRARATRYKSARTIHFFVNLLLGGAALSAQPTVAQPVTPHAVKISDLAGHGKETAAIQNMVAQGIMPITQGAFDPDKATTRADLAYAVQHMFALKSQQVTFTDIPANSTLHASVTAVAPFLGRQLLCPGCALISKFLPNEPVSPVERSVLLINVLRARGTLQILDAGTAEKALANIDNAVALRGPLRLYIATAVQNGLLTAQELHSAPDTRARTAAQLDAMQERFKLPRVAPHH